MNRYRHLNIIVVCLLLFETHAIALLNWRVSWPTICGDYLCNVSVINQATNTLLQRVALPENAPTAIVMHQAGQHREKWELIYDNNQPIQLIVESNIARRWPGWDSYSYNVLAARITNNSHLASIQEFRAIHPNILYVRCLDETKKCVGYFVLYWRT